MISLQKPLRLPKRTESYPGQWIALTPDKHKILAIARKLDTALKQAREKGVGMPLMIKAPDSHFNGFWH